MDNMLSFEIQWYDPEKNKWSLQSGGNLTFSEIQKEWEWWTTPRPNIGHYRLILIVKQEIVLDERGNTLDKPEEK